MPKSSVSAILNELKHLKELIIEVKNKQHEMNGQLKNNQIDIAKMKLRIGIYASIVPIMTLIIGYLIKTIL